MHWEKKPNESSYLNPGYDGGQWVFPHLLQVSVPPAVVKLERQKKKKKQDFPIVPLFRKLHHLKRIKLSTDFFKMNFP